MQEVGMMRFLLALCAALYLGFVTPLIPVAADDIRMADVFSVDEAGAAAVVRHLYRAGTLQLQGFSYGGLFYYVPLAALKVWGGLGGTVSDRVVIVAIRAVCAIAGMGCIWLTFRIGCLVFGRFAGVTGAILLMVTPTFLRWSVESHPDLPQVFWVLLALYGCCRLCEGFSRKWVALAATSAGLAFGTKYSGIFLLPIIALAVLLPGAGGALDFREGFRRLGKRRYMVALALVAAVFAAVFALTNPYALIRFRTFWADVQFEKTHLSLGHTFLVDRAGFSWLNGLGSMIGGIHSAVLVAYLVLLVGRAVRTRSLPADRGLLLMWIAGFTGYLILTANLMAERHLLPVLPPALLFAGEAYRELWEQIRVRWKSRLAVLPPVLLFVVGCRGEVNGAVGLFAQKWGRDRQSIEIVVGRWLGERFSEGTSVLFDAYAYVPDKFHNAYRTFGQTYLMVNHFRPDLLVVRDAIVNDYRNREDAARSRIGETAYLDSHFFYQYLEAGHISEYRLLRDFGTVAVYERTAQAEGDRPQMSWLELVVRLGGGRAFGVFDSRRKMGDIHASLGRQDEAEREYGLAEKAREDPVKVYEQARAYLREGRLEAAQEIFGQILEMIAGKPPDYRAAVRHDMARRYLETGFHDEAVAEIREVLRLNPDLQEARYDLGIFYLIQGDIRRADSAYAEAVRLYGPNSRAADLLRQLVRQGVRREEAERLLVTYFGAEASKAP